MPRPTAEKSAAAAAAAEATPLAAVARAPAVAACGAAAGSTVREFPPVAVSDGRPVGGVGAGSFDVHKGVGPCSDISEMLSYFLNPPFPSSVARASSAANGTVRFVLLTGASGFIGRLQLAALLQRATSSATARTLDAHAAEAGESRRAQCPGDGQPPVTAPALLSAWSQLDPWGRPKTAEAHPRAGGDTTPCAPLAPAASDALRIGCKSCCTKRPWAIEASSNDAGVSWTPPHSTAASRKSQDPQPPPSDSPSSAASQRCAAAASAAAAGAGEGSASRVVGGSPGALRLSKNLRVYCLVRAADDAAAHERVVAALKAAGVWRAGFARHIVGLAGDVSASEFGLAPAVYKSLLFQVDTVYHTAADIRLLAAYRRLRQVNVLSLKTMVSFCLRGKRKSLHFASTLGIFPQYFDAFSTGKPTAAAQAEAGAEPTDTSTGAHTPEHSQPQPKPPAVAALQPGSALPADPAQSDSTQVNECSMPTSQEMRAAFQPNVGYPWSKWAAEIILLTVARYLHLDVTIYRLPSTCFTYSTGYTQIDNAAVPLLAACLHLGMIPQGCRLTATSAADLVAGRIVDASLAPPARRHAVLHVADRRAADGPLLQSWLAGFGIRCQLSSAASFLAAVRASGPRSPLAPFMSILTARKGAWLLDGADTPGPQVESDAACPRADKLAPGAGRRKPQQVEGTRPETADTPSGISTASCRSATDQTANLAPSPLLLPISCCHLSAVLRTCANPTQPWPDLRDLLMRSFLYLIRTGYLKADSTVFELPSATASLLVPRPCGGFDPLALPSLSDSSPNRFRMGGSSVSPTCRKQARPLKKCETPKAGSPLWAASVGDLPAAAGPAVELLGVRLHLPEQLERFEALRPALSLLTSLMNVRAPPEFEAEPALQNGRTHPLKRPQPQAAAACPVEEISFVGGAASEVAVEKGQPSANGRLESEAGAELARRPTFAMRFLIYRLMQCALTGAAALGKMEALYGKSIAGTPVKAPVFIVGLDRGACAFLQLLLCVDDENFRCPAAFEMICPYSSQSQLGESTSAITSKPDGHSLVNAKDETPAHDDGKDPRVAQGQDLLDGIVSLVNGSGWLGAEGDFLSAAVPFDDELILLLQGCGSVLLATLLGHRPYSDQVLAALSRSDAKSSATVAVSPLCQQQLKSEESSVEAPELRSPTATASARFDCLGFATQPEAADQWNKTSEEEKTKPFSGTPHTGLLFSLSPGAQATNAEAALAAAQPPTCDDALQLLQGISPPLRPELNYQCVGPDSPGRYTELTTPPRNSELHTTPELSSYSLATGSGPASSVAGAFSPSGGRGSAPPPLPDGHTAYDMHRRFLQHLQSQQPGAANSRWVLASPSHLAHLPALLETYPDSQVVWLHSDPSEAFASWCTYVGEAHTTLYEHAPAHATDDANLHLLGQVVGNAVRARAGPRATADSRFYDLCVQDVVDMPLAVLRTLYQRLGIPFGSKKQQAVGAFLRAHRTQLTALAKHAQPSGFGVGTPRSSVAAARTSLLHALSRMAEPGQRARVTASLHNYRQLVQTVAPTTWGALHNAAFCPCVYCRGASPVPYAAAAVSKLKRALARSSSQLATARVVLRRPPPASAPGCSCPFLRPRRHTAVACPLCEAGQQQMHRKGNSLQCAFFSSTSLTERAAAPSQRHAGPAQSHAKVFQKALSLRRLKPS
eukprot:GHVT01040318.1.p1 GENE.GHVT01040318.1~~GHVT01040318.1.p1  ORF type:complete len:1678 (+),score=394.89 GHVT01040318.1:481-5514(+)